MLPLRQTERLDMEFDPQEFGLIDDGSTIEVTICLAQKGRLEEAVEVFQETFSEYKPEGFKILFAAADIAHDKLIWVHRYEKGFDLENRFYFGKYPKLVFCLWSIERYDVFEASPEET